VVIFEGSGRGAAPRTRSRLVEQYVWREVRHGRHHPALAA
jgi:hypothetical protein